MRRRAGQVGAIHGGERYERAATCARLGGIISISSREVEGEFRGFRRKTVTPAVPFAWQINLAALRREQVGGWKLLIRRLPRIAALHTSPNVNRCMSRVTPSFTLRRQTSTAADDKADETRGCSREAVDYGLFIDW